MLIELSNLKKIIMIFFCSNKVNYGTTLSLSIAQYTQQHV